MAIDFFRIQKGITLTPRSSAPSSPTNGDCYYDSTLHKLRLYANGAWVELDDSASGDVQGPASATDGAIALFDGTTGKLLKNSTFVINSSGLVIGSDKIDWDYVSTVSSSENIFDLYYSITPGGGSSQDYHALNIEIEPKGANCASSNQFRAIYARASVDTDLTANMGDLIAVHGYINNSSAYNVDSGISFYASMDLAASSTMTNYYGFCAAQYLDEEGPTSGVAFNASSLSVSANSAINMTAFGLKIGAMSISNSGAGDANAYGIYIYDILADDTAYSIYTNAGKVRHEGQTIVGDSELSIGRLQASETNDGSANNFGIHSQMRMNSAGVPTGATWAGGQFDMRRQLSANVSGEDKNYSALFAQMHLDTDGNDYQHTGVQGDISTVRIALFEINGAGTVDIANAAGILIEDPSAGSSAFTNKYGIFINSINGASGENYAIYSSGGASYHEGELRLGTTDTGAAKLHVKESWGYGSSGSLAKMDINAYTANLTGAVQALDIESTRTITASNTDTGKVHALALRSTFDVATSQTLSQAQTSPSSFYSTLHVQAPSLTGGGSLDIDHFAYLAITSNTHVDTGTNKYGIYIDQIWGATNNWGIYQSYASQENYFAGRIRIGTADSILSASEKFGVYRLYTGTSSDTNIAASIYSRVITNDNLSSGSAFAAYIRKRREITDDVTDTQSGGFSSTGGLVVESDFSVATTKTYSATRMATLYISNVSSVDGILDIDYCYGMFINSSSVDTGGRKTAIKLPSTWSGCTYNTLISDSDAYTDDYVIYLINTNRSYFAGPLSLNEDGGVITGLEMLSVTRDYNTGSPASSHIGATINWDLETDDALTAGQNCAIYSRWRRVIANDVTDAPSGGFGAIQNMYISRIYEVASTKTYTLTDAQGMSAIHIPSVSLSGGGSLDVDYMQGIYIGPDSEATGTNKYGIRIGALSGATNNYAIKTGTGKVALGDDLYVNLDGPTILNQQAIVGYKNHSTVGENAAAIISYGYFPSTSPYTVNSNSGLYSRLYRVTTSSVTDTAGYWAAITSGIRFNVSAAQTYTCSGTYGFSGLFVAAPINNGSGDLAIDVYNGIIIQDSSLDTGTNKYGLVIGGQTGATNNWALYTAAGRVRFGDTVETGDSVYVNTTNYLTSSTEVLTAYLYDTDGSANAVGLCTRVEAAKTSALGGANARGAEIEIQRTYGGNTISEAKGLFGSAFRVLFNGSGSYTNTDSNGDVCAIRTISPSFSGGGTVALTNLSGIKIADQGVSQATNLYGLYIGDQTSATNNYAIKTGSGLVKFGDQVTSLAGSGSTYQIVGGTLFASATATEANVGSGETTVVTKTISGDTLYDRGAHIKVRFGFKCAANTNNKTIRIKYAGSTIYTHSTTTSADAGEADITLYRGSSTAGYFHGKVIADGGNSVDAATFSATHASSNDFVITLQGTSDNDIWINGIHMEYGFDN